MSRFYIPDAMVSCHYRNSLTSCNSTNRICEKILSSQHILVRYVLKCHSSQDIATLMYLPCCKREHSINKWQTNTQMLSDWSSHLLEKAASFTFTKTSFLNNVVKQLPWFDVLHHHKDVCWSLYDFIQPYNMRVHKQSQNLDLPQHCQRWPPTVKDRALHSMNLHK